jgi:glutathione synthase/RimK-type ligase-like ATP-grasp enzyme
MGRPEDLVPERYIKADLVYDRGGFQGSDIMVLNPKAVTKLGSDKTEMYRAFGDMQPYSMTVHSKQQLERAFRKLATDKVVVKDPTGYGGTGVIIGTRDEVRRKLAEAPLSYPLLAQELMDTSVGVPGLVEGVHDMRLIIGGGRIWSCYIRQPKKGELRANVALGGSFQYIPRHKIPRQAIFLAHKIDAHFGFQPRHYAIDFANTDEGWKLIELNANPGLVPSSYAPETAYEMSHLANYLARQVRMPHPSVAVEQLYHTRLRPYLPELSWPRTMVFE